MQCWAWTFNWVLRCDFNYETCLYLCLPCLLFHPLTIKTQATFMWWLISSVYTMKNYFINFAKTWIFMHYNNCLTMKSQSCLTAIKIRLFDEHNHVLCIVDWWHTAVVCYTYYVSRQWRLSYVVSVGIICHCHTVNRAWLVTLMSLWVSHIPRFIVIVCCIIENTWVCSTLHSTLIHISSSWHSCGTNNYTQALFQ